MFDTRFTLVRHSRHGIETWHAALIQPRGGGASTFRLTWPRRTKDRFGQAERLADLSEVASKVVRQGARIRWISGRTGQSNSLGLASRGVLRYELDPAVAAAFGLPASGTP